MKRRNYFLQVVAVFVLTLIIVIAVAAQFLIRPDRAAVFTVMYTGDIQGSIHYSEGNNAGYEKIASLAASAEEGGKTFLIDAGGCLGGSEAAETDSGASMIEMMNAAGYDALVPGPKDFVYGIDALQSLRAQAAFPFLAANLVRSDGTRLFENYAVFSDGDVRIGIIGVTNGISQQAAARASVTVLDPVTTAEAAVKELSGKTDAVIVAAYTGNEETTRRLASIDGVSLVIESGTLLAAESQPEDAAPIVSAGQGGTTVGEAQIKIKRGKVSMDVHAIGPEVYDAAASDAHVLETIEACLKNQQALRSEVVGVFEQGTFDSPGADAEDSQESEAEKRVQIETPTGDMVTDAMLYAAAKDGAEIALIRSSSIRGTLKDGSATRGELDDLFDDSLSMVTCRMTGGELRKMLEDSFSGYPDAKNSLQVSGLKMIYDPSTQIGSALSEITVGSHSLDDARIYTVSITDDMLASDAREAVSRDVIAYYKCMGSVMNTYVSDRSGFTLETPDEPAEETEDTRVTRMLIY